MVELAKSLKLDNENQIRADLIENIINFMVKNEDDLKAIEEFHAYYSDPGSKRKSTRKSTAVTDDDDTSATPGKDNSLSDYQSSIRSTPVNDDKDLSPNLRSPSSSNYSQRSKPDIDNKLNLNEILSKAYSKYRDCYACSMDKFNRSQIFLSDSQHLLLITLLVEFLTILYIITPLRIHRLTVPSNVSNYFEKPTIDLKLPYCHSLLSKTFLNPLKHYFIYSLLTPFIPSLFINWERPQRLFSPLTFSLIRLSTLIIFNSQQSIENYLQLRIEFTTFVVLSLFSLIELLTNQQKQRK